MADEVLKMIVSADPTPAIAAFKELSKVTAEFGNSVKAGATTAAQSFNQLFSGAHEAMAGLKRAAAEQKTAFESLKPSAEEISKIFKDAGKNLQDLGKTLTTHLTVPLTAAAAGLIAVGASFDAAFDKIRGKTGATGAELEGLKESFRTVFASVPQNANEVS